MQSMQQIGTKESAQKPAGRSKPSWKKPQIVETPCGLEINCYATSKG